jgi:hypothetical protein
MGDCVCGNIKHDYTSQWWSIEQGKMLFGFWIELSGLSFTVNKREKDPTFGPLKRLIAHLRSLKGRLNQCHVPCLYYFTSSLSWLLNLTAPNRTTMAVLSIHCVKSQWYISHNIDWTMWVFNYQAGHNHCLSNYEIHF